MKHLKSSLQDLRELFDIAITVKHIAEPLASFDENQPAQTVQAFMQEKDFDIVGVRRNGAAVGYADRREMDSGDVGNHLRPFEPDLIRADSAPLREVLEILTSSPRAFVSSYGQVAGIVTRGDLQKAPVRMYLFGLVSLIEMQMLRIIRLRCPGDTWAELLKPKRIQAAKRILSDRQQANEAIDLADCLEFSDKRQILLKVADPVAILGFNSRKRAARHFWRLEKLRNDVAHSQPFRSEAWCALSALVDEGEDTLGRLESIIG